LKTQAHIMENNLSIMAWNSHGCI